MDSITERKCKECGEIKTISDFRKRSGKRDRGYRYTCASCERKYQKNHREENLEKVKEYQKKYREENFEKAKEYQKKYREENIGNNSERKEYYKEYHKKYYQKHRKEYSVRERGVRQHKERYTKSKEEVKERNKKSYEEKRDKRNDGRRKHYAENPEKHQANQHRRRARMAGCEGTYTAQEWTDLCAHYGNRCLRCGRDDVKLTVDHVVPIIKGGSNSIGNLQPLCKACNSSKYTDTIDYRY